MSGGAGRGDANTSSVKGPWVPRGVDGDNAITLFMLRYQISSLILYEMFPLQISLGNAS